MDQTVKTSFQKFLEKATSTKYKILAIIVTSICVSLLLKFEYRKEIYPEEIPAILEQSDQVKKLASNVTVGIHINTFPQFSFTQGDFSMDAIIWFRFPKATETLDTIDNFVIHNSQFVSKDKMLYKSPPIIKVLKDDVLIAFHIQAKYKTTLEYKKFPIGDHRLNFILINKSVTSRELVFNTSGENITLSNDIMVDDWKPKKTFAKGGYIKSILNPKDSDMEIDHPCAVFSIDFESIGGRSLISLYFPLFVVFFIGLLSLLINIFDLTRLGMIASSLPMLVLFRLVIESISPHVAYPTHIDFVYYALVFLSLIILFIQMYVILEGQNVKDSEDKVLKKRVASRLENINTASFYTILLSIILLMVYNFLR